MASQCICAPVMTEEKDTGMGFIDQTHALFDPVFFIQTAFSWIYSMRQAKESNILFNRGSGAASQTQQSKYTPFP